MIKSIISEGFSAALELGVFWIAVSKIYDDESKVIIVCMFLISLIIRTQIVGVGMVSMMAPSLVIDQEKERN